MFNITWICVACFPQSLDKKEDSVEISNILKIKTSRQSNMNEEQKWLNELAEPESQRILETYQNLIK